VQFAKAISELPEIEIDGRRSKYGVEGRNSRGDDENGNRVSPFSQTYMKPPKAPDKGCDGFPPTCSMIWPIVEKSVNFL
jgi:hypothetical protein